DAMDELHNYGGGHELQSRPREKKHEQMIRNDQSFADAFVAFGDELSIRGDLNLSFLAYTRAMMIGHPLPEEIRKRRRRFLRHKNTYIDCELKFRGKKRWEKEVKEAEEKIHRGLKWLAEFKKTESTLLEGKDDERIVDFKMVEKLMLKRGIKKVRA
ncbi:MAG: hypothetical protein AAGC74_13390, partial [Verrucomicrobiota bacterium]